MAYGSVQIPAGCSVAVGDTVGELATGDLGVLKGDATLEISYTPIKVLGSKAESLVDYMKDMKVNGAFELYQLYLPNIVEFLAGVATVTATAGVEVAGHTQDWAADTTAAGTFYPFDMQQSAGTTPTAISVAGDPDGTPDAYVLNTDYRVIQVNGIWGLLFVTGSKYTVGELIRATYTITPASAQTLKMGAATASITPKIVQFSKTISGKIYRARLWSATADGGLTITFPDSAGDEPASLPISIVGSLDTTKTSGEQLIEIYDEIGITFP